MIITILRQNTGVVIIRNLEGESDHTVVYVPQNSHLKKRKRFRIVIISYLLDEGIKRDDSG